MMEFYDKVQMRAGIEQAQWDCLMTVLRFGIPNGTILHIAEKVRNIQKPQILGCKYFRVSEAFIESIPRLPLTEEDFENLRYTKDELREIYELKPYDGGIKFVEIAYIVYLLAAEISIRKIVRMFKVTESYVQDIQDRFMKQVPDTYSQEEFIRFIWEENIYIMNFQIVEKREILQVDREYIINLLKNTLLPVDMIANIFDVPVDAIIRVMRSVGMKKREDMPVYHENEEPDDDETARDCTEEPTIPSGEAN